jgi:hypothetical protein
LSEAYRHTPAINNHTITKCSEEKDSKTKRRVYSTEADFLSDAHTSIRRKTHIIAIKDRTIIAVSGRGIRQ